MSERKTAEIKFRCTPSFKSGLQASAEASGQSMSEYIESAVGEKQRAKIDDLWVREAETTKRAIESLREIGAGDSGAVARLHADSEQALATKTATQQIIEDEEIPTGSDVFFDDDSFLASLDACTCRPWEFCHHKASA